MYNYNIISDEKSYLEGKKQRAELKKKKYEENCRKVAQKWAIMFDRDAMNGELHRMFIADVKKYDVNVYDVYNLFDEYID